jgi:cobalt/nickel transport protein
MKRLLFPLTAALLFLTAAPAGAHYNMLLLDKHSVKKDEAVTLTYQWGHPFEHQLFDAPQPEKLIVLAPDGKATDLTKSLEKTTVPAAEGKKVTAYRVKFTPEQRGDYVFVLQTPPIWMEEDQEFLQDTVKVVVHVQAQKGWDAALSPDFEPVPLTRPYGLQPGMVFQTRTKAVLPVPFEGKPGELPPLNPPLKLQPLGGALVEVERYNAAPPKELPPDEHITRVVKTDPGGVATCTLTDPGWWSVTAYHFGGQREHEGKKYPVRQRATLWVFVDEKPKADK